MSNIPVHSIARTVSHPAWTPVEIDGSALSPAGVVGGDQEFFTGQMITLSGYSTGDKIEDHTGDGDSADQMRSVNYELPQARKLTCIVPAGWTWIPAMLHTIFRDANKRPMTITDTYVTGKTLEQQFLIGMISHPIEAKDVLKIEADLTPHGAATETGLT